LICTALLSGCLSKEEPSVPTADLDIENTISGSIGDGPVVGATVNVYRNDGAQLAQLDSGANANYNVTVKTKGKYYALRIAATGGTDLVTNRPPDFKLDSAVLRPDKRSIANVNPFSTFTVALASYMPGGASADNLSSAQSIVSQQLNAGLSTLAMTGPMTTAIDENNITEIVKASETLGETVRRVRDRMQSAGYSLNADAVVEALSSDLTDEVVDGLGGPRVDARIAAVATLVYAQVLIESMANELYVDGVDATRAIENAIVSVSSATPTRTLEDIPVTAEMLFRARIGLAAAYAVNPDPAIIDLHTVVSGLQAGQSPAVVRLALPADYGTTLGTVLDVIAGSEPTTIDLVNSIARTSGDIDSGSNTAPSISGTPATAVRAGSLYTFTPTASDADRDTLTFSVSGAPAWATFDAASGELSGTPAVSDVGTYSNIVVSVSDGEFSASLAPFQISVTSSNAAPTISGSPATSVQAGSVYSFTPTASDPDGDVLTFSIDNLPPWASFDTGTGHFSGTPANMDAGTYRSIIISASDGEFSASLPAFSITVDAAAMNNPPQISGTPVTSINERQSYSFTPGASDPDGDSLTFQISGQPTWTSFDAATGTLSGTPGAADVGVYTNIVISVSDGQASASLQAFDIMVNAVSLGSVTLSWTPPTANEDGTALTDLAGYKLYWGTTPGSYTSSVTIDNSSVSTWVVDNLSPGTYEFVATSYNTAGVESAYSNIATRVVQ
jgi:hypothetical protein